MLTMTVLHGEEIKSYVRCIFFKKIMSFTRNFFPTENGLHVSCACRENGGGRRKKVRKERRNQNKPSPVLSIGNVALTKTSRSTQNKHWQRRHAGLWVCSAVRR